MSIAPYPANDSTSAPPGEMHVAPCQLGPSTTPSTAALRAAIDGLTRTPKTLPCQFFYDDRGSRLFDRICELPEYYPTRTESAIMRRHARAMAKAVGPGPLLVEYGSGSSTKTRLLLDALVDPAGYVPIDISRGHLMDAARGIAADYSGLRVSPVCADYTRPFPLPIDPAEQNVVAYFPGSTIGNFEPDAAVAFLANIRRTCGPASSLLIGVDRKKDPARLHAAYNDAAGVTAQFNLNLLHRINRELPDSHIDVSAFAHYAPFVPAKGRMEMHLVSLRRQTVTIAGRPIEFELGESIHTESCHKFTPESFAALAAAAGYRPRQTWTDDEGLFGVHLLTAGPR
jgi:dimethylhistidine N-methyltransferase